MPRKKADTVTAPAKSRWDTSPGNPDGYRTLKDWGTKETQVAVEVITRLALNNRAAFRAEPALHPWSYNTGDPINQKLRQLLTKLCKDHEVDFSSVSVARSPQKREAEQEDEKKPVTSPKKSKPSPAKKAVKKDVISPKSTDSNEDDTVVTDESSVSEETNVTPSPSSTPKQKVSGSPPVKKGREVPTTPKKMKEEPVTPVKSLDQEKDIAKGVKTPSPSPEDKMDVDVEDEGEDEKVAAVKQTRRKKKVISDDYSPSRSVTPAPAPALALSSEIASGLILSPNRPKRGCARQTNYNLALKFDGLDEYLKEKEEGVFEEESEQEDEQSVDGDEEEKAGEGEGETEDEGDESASDEEDKN